MAKYIGTKTKSGRVGGSVFAMRSGICIERQYNPFVLNPKSIAQSEQRAKLKLASQLSAVLGKDELIGFKPNGLMSSRNLFVKDLFSRGVVTYSDNTASIALDRVRLTDSVVDMMRSPLEITRATATSVTVNGSLLSEYIGKVVGIRYVALFPRPVEGSTELAIASAGLLELNQTTGEISGTITGLGNQGVTVLIYAYAPISQRVLERYTEMVTTGTSASVTLEYLRTTSPSGMMFSATLGYNVPAQG